MSAFIRFTPALILAIFLLAPPPLAAEPSHDSVSWEKAATRTAVLNALPGQPHPEVRPPFNTADTTVAIAMRAGDPVWIARWQQALVEMQLRYAVQNYWFEYQQLPANAAELLTTGQLRWVPQGAADAAAPVVLDGAAVAEQAPVLRIGIQEESVTAHYPSWEQPVSLDMARCAKRVSHTLTYQVPAGVEPVTYWMIERPAFHELPGSSGEFGIRLSTQSTGDKVSWHLFGVDDNCTYWHLVALNQILYVYGFIHGQLPETLADAEALVRLTPVTPQDVITASGAPLAWREPLPYEMDLIPQQHCASFAIALPAGVASPEEEPRLLNVWSLQQRAGGNTLLSYNCQVSIMQGIGGGACRLPPRKSKAAANSDT